jgi:hypothetical protein
LFLSFFLSLIGWLVSDLWTYISPKLSVTP